MADVVILDLEDAVAPDLKSAARDYVLGLADSGVLVPERTVLRVNGCDTPEHAADIELATAAGIRIVMLSKAEHPHDIAAISHDVIALIETPRGVEWAGALAEAANVVGLMWGADDLVAGLGGTSSRYADGVYRGIALHARHRVLVAAKACDRLALDGVHMDIPDLDGLAAECEDAAAVGFDVSVAIHPTQLDTIRAAYSPAADTVAWARRLLEHADSTRGVTTFEGRMVDGPIYKQAERVLRLAATSRTGGVDG